MRDDYRRLPKVLKKNIICRIGLGLAFLTFFILMCFFVDHFIFALAPCAFALFLVTSGISMMVRCISGEYVELKGVCIEVNKSTFRRKTKYIVLKTNRGIVKILTKFKQRTINVGDSVTVYVPDYASVYEYKESMVICEFYGFDVSREKEKRYGQR